MKTKREYEEAFDLIDIFTSCGCNEVDDCNCCVAYDKGLKQQHGCELDLALNMFKELIEEHFEPKENTEEYKHFKLHSDSSLKNLTKVELIDYIKMLYHNWGVADEQLKNCIDANTKLKGKYSKILDDVHDYRFETHCMKVTIRNLCKHFGVKNEAELKNIYLNKPCKFEDLKPNMWVWDNVAKECLYVVRPFITTGVRVKYFTCLGIWNLEKIKKLNMKFEENRFFPVQCANWNRGD